MSQAHYNSIYFCMWRLHSAPNWIDHKKFLRTAAFVWLWTHLLV